MLEAQDTVQDAFLAAGQGLAGFRGDCEFGTWLHPIVTRLALSQARTALTVFFSALGWAGDLGAFFRACSSLAPSS